MSSNADATINALRAGHDELVAVVATLSPQRLIGPSQCADWDVSEVLSHLGSGAEITLAGLQRALDPTVVTPPNTQVWDRWNAMGAQDRAAAFAVVDEALVLAYEALDDDTRGTLLIDLGFLPEPVDVATAAGLRLNEFALHSWDVRAALDPSATVDAGAAAALVDSSGLLLGWIGKAAEIDGDVQVLVETTGPARVFGLAITDAVSKGEAPDAADATLRLPAESWLRLTTGRLSPETTSDAVTVSGSITLDDLRRVFPGF